MAINQKDIQQPERLRAFVAQFQPDLGRSERVAACTAYISDLLTPHKQAKRSVASCAFKPHALRQFVNRSLWRDDAVMTRLRDLVFAQNPEGALVLTELHIDKKGRQSIGTDRQYAEPLPQIRHRRRKANCQTMVLWSWITDAGACPVAAQLYLPPRWTMDTTRTKRMAIPADSKIYHTKVQIALSLLDQIRLQFASQKRLSIDIAFEQEWDLLKGFDQRHEVYLAQLSFSGNLPLPSPPSGPSASNHEWKVFFEQIRAAQKFKVQMFVQELEDQGLLKHINLGEKPPWGPPMSSDQYLFRYRNPQDHFGFYLINRGDLPREELVRMNTAVYAARKLGAALLNHGGLRRFEGRSWRGFHHHVTLCFMAHYFAAAVKSESPERIPASG